LGVTECHWSITEMNVIFSMKSLFPSWQLWISDDDHCICLLSKLRETLNCPAWAYHPVPVFGDHYNNIVLREKQSCFTLLLQSWCFTERYPCSCWYRPVWGDTSWERLSWPYLFGDPTSSLAMWPCCEWIGFCLKLWCRTL
jgi:hypothetical protein